MEKIPYPMTGMHAEDTVRPESMWLCVAANDKAHLQGASLDTFFRKARASLIQDQCMIAHSLHSGLTIILSIHCPYLAHDNHPSTNALLNTEALLLSTFGKDDFVISPDSPNTPHLNTLDAPSTEWYGTYENAGIVMRGEHLTHEGFRVLSEKQIKELYASEFYQSRNVPWHLDRIDMHQGMLNSQYMYLNDGSNTDVYILDSGIRYTHEEFEGRARLLYSTVRDGITTDCGSGHGTHVAGLIGSKTFGVAKKPLLFAVRVLDCEGAGSAKDIVEGVDVVLNRTLRSKRRSVINLSLGGDKNNAVDFQVRRLRAAGVVVVVAAGNEGMDACQYSPSNLGVNNYILTVGASDRQDNRPSWSNYGSCVSLSAPGVSITSLSISSDTALTTKDGTSMATPLVTGAAALIVHQDSSISVDDVNNLIVTRGTPVYSRIVLYAPIDVSASPFATPPPTYLVATPPPTLITFNSADKEHNSGTSLIFFLSINLLWLLCMM